MSDSAAELLSDLRQLRRKVRRDRRGYWFPLVLFAALILLSLVAYWSPANPYGRASQWSSSSPVVQWYWMIGLTACLLVSVWWYRRHGVVAGVEVNVNGFLAVAAGALVGVVFGQQMLDLTAWVHYDTLLSGRPDITLRMMTGAAIIAAVALVVGTRWKRLWMAGVSVAAVFTMVAFSAMAIYFAGGLEPLLIIAGAMLALAWLERSLFLAVIGVLFTAASVHANMGNPWILYGAGHQLNLLLDPVLPAAVLMIGGVIALIRTRQTGQGHE